MILSIVIPAYNCEKYIENCIESIMTQNIDRSEYEVIIINDGSTDNTRQKCEELSEKYGNITLINTENNGQAHARNIGIKKASGEYIEFVDSDDYIAHNMFKELSDISAKEEPDVIYFGVKSLEVYDDYDFDESAKISVYESGQDCFVNGVYNGPWTYWVKREFLINSDLSFIEGRFVEDAMFTCALFSIAGKTVAWDIQGYRYVINENSTIVRKDRPHQKKMIDDYEFCVYYLDELHANMSKKTDNIEYLDTLINRMGSFIFFLQMRMLRYGDYKLGKAVLNRLQGKNLYPYKWNPYKKLKLIYRLSNMRIAYLFILKILDCKTKICNRK